jgi:uncharacterized protein
MFRRMSERAETKNDTTKTDESSSPKARRGFARMDRDKVREIARLGGKAAHECGTAHEFTSEEARAAGRKGGLAPHKSRGAK